jgi:hypothetical protein
MGSDYGGCKGNKFERVCGYLHQYGVVEDACFPYTASEIPCDNRCGDSSIAYIDRWRLMDYSYIWYVRYLGWDNNLYYGQFYIPSVEAIKSELLDGPVPVGMAVFSDFYDYYGGVYDPSDFTYEGLHSVLIIGWDDTLRSWICRNSWGESWGENGNFLIPWTEESFDIRNYDWSYECGYDLCICNYTLMGFNAVEIDPTFEQPTTTTTSIVVITSTTTIPTTTTTSIVTTTIPATTTTSIATTTSSTTITSTSSSTTTTIISDLVIKGRVIESEPGFERSLQGIKVDLICGDKFDWRLTNVYGEFEFENLLMGQTYVIIVEDNRTRYPENYVLYLTRSVEDLLFVIVEEEKCIVQRTFGDDSKITNSLRWFRDSILMKYEWGRYLVESYYGFSIMKNS